MDDASTSDEALHLRRLLAERAQRTAELTALHEITAQLATLRDPESLLQDIATRARDLLRVDVAYIALNDGTGGLTIQVVAGSLGQRMQGLRLTRDTGIAGLVLTRGEPFWTDDYTNEPRIRHSEAADAAARDERLGGILGVPLRARDEVIGVLFASDRDVRPFTEPEVTLLSSLAAHAASAIDNARLYESVRRATALHERLTDIVVRGGGVPEVVAAVAKVLDVDVAYRPDVVEGSAGTSVAPVNAGDDALGCLVAVADLPVNDRRQLERGAMVIALVLVRERALVAAEARARTELVEALISGPADHETLQRRAQAAGLGAADQHVVAVIVGDGERGELAERAAAQFGGIAGARAHDAVAILHSDDTATVSEWFRRASALDITVGLVGASRVEDLRSAHDDARKCVTALLALGRVGGVASPAELGMYRFLLSSDGRRDAADFVERTVGALLEADRVKGSELAHTLEEYLASGRHHAATATALFIHPNTLYQRLARVATILGDDWKDPDRCLEVQTALRLHRIASSYPEP